MLTEQLRYLQRMIDVGRPLAHTLSTSNGETQRRNGDWFGKEARLGLKRAHMARSEENGLRAAERQTICFPHHGTQKVLQRGDDGFEEAIYRLYSVAENNAMEQLVTLKSRLNALPTEDFLPAVTEGLCEIIGADISFIMKRMLVDDQDATVEMPPIGTQGACIMAAALHYCVNDNNKATLKDVKFQAYECPCAYMRHDKVFLIPDRLNDFITNNPNKLPTPCEAYIAVPLFADGKCFAHFGTMWSREKAASRQLSWAFIEMLMHSLEDLITQRLLERSNLPHPEVAPNRKNVIPHEAVTAAQSLRPYAGSLSHELRTPMQGIVGMLDVMYATVQEAVEMQVDPKLRLMLENLKQGIETVQDSSRRAVEAADNIVHAYDMDMSVPDAPACLLDDVTELLTPTATTKDRRPDIFIAGSDLPMPRNNKRRRDESADADVRSSPKQLRLTKKSTCHCRETQETELGSTMLSDQGPSLRPDKALTGNAANTSESPTRNIAPGLRHTNLRELVQHVINEGLKVGGRPDSAMAQETDLGEIIEVRSRGSDGMIGCKVIEWSIDPNVPPTLFLDEKDFSKAVSCVFLNAIKFTSKMDGRVKIHAFSSSRHRYLTLRISDNGPGIPASFQPKLFTAFSQENASITRLSDGLGLGLMVAKGIVRKLGGDLVCAETHTEGPNRGTHFEIKIPFRPGDSISRPSSPFSSPRPQQAIVIKDHDELSDNSRLPPIPESLPRLTQTSFEAAETARIQVAMPATPPPRISVLSEQQSSPHQSDSPSPHSIARPIIDAVRPRLPKKAFSTPPPKVDRSLAARFPLTFLVAEDNRINRKLLVSMLAKLGYATVHEAHDGAEAVRQMSLPRPRNQTIDIILMDLWMPLMDGYQATEKILAMQRHSAERPTVLAVTADVTDGALERAAQVGMKGFMTKPFKMVDLQRLIEEYCANHRRMDGNV